MSKVHTDVWLFSFRRWDINSSSFFTSVMLERTGFSVKIDSFKSRSCTYWLKWELAYFAMSSGRSHLNCSSWFKMVNLFEGYWFSILSDLSLSLPCVGKLRVFFRRFLFYLLLMLIVPTGARRRRTTPRRGRSWTPPLLLLTIFLRTFLRPLLSLSFSGVLVSCIWSLLLDSFSTSAIVLLVLLD